jgi:hypothetical protein
VEDTPKKLVYERAHKQVGAPPAASTICKFKITITVAELDSHATVQSHLIRSRFGNRYLDLASAYDLQKAELQDFYESAASGTPTAPRTIRARNAFEEAVGAKIDRQFEMANSPAQVIGALILGVLCILALIVFITGLPTLFAAF